MMKNSPALDKLAKDQLITCLEGRRQVEVERDRLKADVAELVKALCDLKTVLVLCAERFEVQDGCDAGEPCDNVACGQVGCLCDKRERVRALIAKHGGGGS